MRKVLISLILGFCLLLAILIWGNLAFTYIALRFMGVEILRIGYYIGFDGLNADIKVKTKGRDFIFTLQNIRPKSFFGGGVGIYDLNGYTTYNYGCNDASWKYIYSHRKGRYVSNEWYSSTINIDKHSVFSYYYDVKKSNIPWIINNISIIEAQLMAIPNDRYSYYRSERGDEVYFKRVRRDEESRRLFYEDIKNSDSLFVFQNPDCNPKWMRKTE